MKIYMSYWSGGYQKTPSQYIVDLHKLAAHYATTHYGEVTLITDSKSKHLFESKPFTNITTDLDIFNDTKNLNWALGKLYAYKIIAEKREPFLHIDYDVLLINPIQNQYEKQDIIFQSLECHAYSHYNLELFYSSLQKDIAEKYGFEIPDETHRACNMGIFGCFNNYDFVIDYAENALQFSLEEKVKDTYEIMYKYRTWSPATITEQYYLWLLAKKQNVLLTSYLTSNDETRETLIKTDVEAHDKGYIHLMGFKGREQIVAKVYQKLREFSLI